MSEFDKKIMLDNISFILKEQGKKIGEIEAEAGVSTGYISRITKDDAGKPGIDFIVKIAKALNVSIDTLLNINLSELTPTELYLVSFLGKLKSDTTKEKLEWYILSKDYLNSIETDYDGDVEHPLFYLETFSEENEGGYPEQVTRVVFPSRSFGYHTHINDECYSLRLKNGAVLYLMDISKSVYRCGDKSAFAREIWLYKDGVGSQFLCGNNDESRLSSLVNDVFDLVKNYTKHPKIRKGLIEAIEAFMVDDLEDDYDEYNDPDYPF
ncbi:MAG: helix-turn-helix transcriptional regulator [Clostridia bacterium]|nr:helix-turn-helix transcriptional regulator [Clostridia bacterium]